MLHFTRAHQALMPDIPSSDGSVLHSHDGIVSLAPHAEDSIPRAATLKEHHRNEMGGIRQQASAGSPPSTSATGRSRAAAIAVASRTRHNGSSR